MTLEYMHKKKPYRFHVYAYAVGFEIAFSKKMGLVFADVIESKLVRRTMKMPGELRDGVEYSGS